MFKKITAILLTLVLTTPTYAGSPVIWDKSCASGIQNLATGTCLSTGGGTVDSVGLSLPAEFSVSGSPVTGTGTLSATYANQTQNKVFASPVGSTGTPSFRALAAADIPSLSGTYLPIAGGTMSGNITLAGNASNSLEPVTLQQFSGAINGLDPKNTVTAATNGALPANTYNNGAAGVGATITGNANGALAAQDGVTLITNQTLLVWNEGNAQHNGIYDITQIGSAGTPFILTRRVDMDNGSEADGAVIPILSGVLYGNKGFLQYNPSTTVGASNLAFTVYNNNTVNDDGVTTLLSSGVISVRNGGITNAKVNASAGIVYSKLDLLDSILDSDINSSAAISYGKLNLSGSIQASDLDSAAGVALTQLEATNTNRVMVTNSATGFMENAPAITGSRALVSNASGIPTQSSVTSTELGFLSGATSSIQNQLNSRLSTTLNEGNIIVGDAINEAAEVTMSGDVTINGTGVTDITAGSIVNNDIATGAAIARAKLATDSFNSWVYNDAAGEMTSATLGADQIVVTNGSGTPSTVGITPTELYYAAIGAGAPGVQTQLSGKEPSITATTSADYYRGDKTFQPLNTAARLAISATAPVAYNNGTGVISMPEANAGASGYISNSDWSMFNNKLSNPMSSIGDIIYNDASLNPEALAIGTTGQILAVDGAGLPDWVDLPTYTASRVLVSNGSGVPAASSVTSTTLAFLDATSSVQTQINSKQAGPLTGDVTTSGAAATLATVNSNVGSFTKANITVNAKGLITSASSNNEQTLKVTGTQSNATNIPANITELTTTSLAAGTYKFSGVIIFQTPVTTTGIGFRINPATATLSQVYGGYSVAQAASGVSHYFEYDQLSTATNVVSASVLTANTDAIAYFSGTFTVSSPGTVAMQFRSEVNTSSVSVRAGSYMTVEGI